MVLHKQHNTEYEPFLKLVTNLAQESASGLSNLGMIDYQDTNTATMLEKYSHMIQNLVLFEKDAENDSDPVSLTNKLKQAVKRIIPVKDADLFLFDESFANLISINRFDNSDLAASINKFFTEGILTLNFETGTTAALPDFNTYNGNGAKLNYIIYPILEDGKKKGLFAILSSMPTSNITELDKQIIRILLNAALSKIDKFALKEKLYSTYEELQTYQAKLSNDYRLAAIGEMTEGILEDVISPLQVILSQVDMLNNGEDSIEVRKIKSQIKKINSVVHRLIKFANVNQEELEIYPCNLNDLINQYYEIVKSTLESARLECVLDLAKSLPSILSNPNYIFQILTNAIGLIKNSTGKAGGILLQTGYQSDVVFIKIISTASINMKKEMNAAMELSIKIVRNLIKKHEGEFVVDSFDGSGSTIYLRFPLRRKFRK
ncbi:MAG: hypothetical protein V1720_01250 [bacterium]